ncbi:MAG: dicarboxylate/amino acid:cation symporter [Phycisphaerales bacterium]
MSPTHSERKPAKIAPHWWIVFALIAGVLVGVGLSSMWSWQSVGVGDSAAFLAAKPSDANSSASAFAHVARFTIDFNKFIGDLFVRLLRLIAVPVVLFSLVAAVAGVGDFRKLGRLGGKTLGIFALTAVAAVCIALVITNVVRPGRFVSTETKEQLLAQQATAAAARVQTADKFGAENTIWSQILDAFPANPFAALSTGNMLQVVTLSLLLGIGLTLLHDDQRRKAHEMFEILAAACLKVVGLVMKLAPIAVFCLTASMVAQLGWSVVAALSVFVAATAGGLAIILFVQYPAIMFAFTRGAMKPTTFFRAMAPAKLLAFSSSSSAATLPVTMECTRRLGVSEQVTGFVLPLGTTINMDGTALYQVMCVTFLAQLFGVDLTLADQVTVAFMAILVAIGSPGLPGASLVLMVFILEAVNVPAQGMAIILAVDRILDMCRTVVNVAGDAAAAVVVAHSEGELEPQT